MSNRQDEQPDNEPGRALARGVNLLCTLEDSGDAVAISPDGRTVVSRAYGGLLRLWSADDGRLIRTLNGRVIGVNSIAYDPTGRRVTTGSNDGRVRVWDAAGGDLLHSLKAHDGSVNSVAFDPTGRKLASGGDDGAIKLWDAAGGKWLNTLKRSVRSVRSVAFDPNDPRGRKLASGGDDGLVRVWGDAASGNLVHALDGQTKSVMSVAFDPTDRTGRVLASGGDDGAVRVWDAASRKLLRTLEGHTEPVDFVAFSLDGRLLASKGGGREVRLWSCETWEPVAVLSKSTPPFNWIEGIALHPARPLLVTSGSTLRSETSRLPHVWELDYDALLGKTPWAKPAAKAVHHLTAKVVLVGDHSVGKSALGYKLAHGDFTEQSSTHGQKFWVLPQLAKLRDDGTECEAILWDLAGQPDYRLIHALFLDDVDLALVLFDSSDISDPLHGVEFWLHQLKIGREEVAAGADGKPASCRAILVGARNDRGTPALTDEELQEFCRRRGVGGYVSTSAKEGTGIEELVARMKELIPWEEKSTTTTTITFKRIKDYVLSLKEGRQEGRPVVVTPDELREQLRRASADWQSSHGETMAAAGHLENYGYVRRLRTSTGEERVLLAPELLNNLAASFVLEARRNPQGLGSLEERRLLAGEYRFPELEKLSPAERDILIDSAALLFLKHNVCFRETDPLSGHSYLVFPELINLRKPVLDDEQPIEEGVSYTVAGAVENVYASLVVLLGYTPMFKRTDQWRRQARYEVGDKLICGFRQEAERDGELDFVLYFAANVGQPVRTLFQGLFESFLARRNLSVFRYEPAVCENGHALNREVVRQRLREGRDFAFCSECGEKVALPKAREPIQLTQTERRKVDEQQWFAARRTSFEQAVFQVKSFVKEKELAVPNCFISYARGDRAHERWVERNLATDLQKAGVKVVLDKWENARVGARIPRFVERIAECDRVIVVGTLLYRKKYENKDAGKGYVLAAEFDLISNRLLDTEDEKESVLPVLLDGNEKDSLPPLLQRRVYADFRDEQDYFIMALDLIISLYRISFNNPAVADLRESLR